VLSIFCNTSSGAHGSKVKQFLSNFSSIYFSISLLPIIGFTDVSEV